LQTSDDLEETSRQIMHSLISNTILLVLYYRNKCY